MDVPDTEFELSEDIPDSGEHALEETDSMKERVKFVLEWESAGMKRRAESTSLAFVASLGSVDKWGMFGFDVIDMPSTTWAL